MTPHPQIKADSGRHPGGYQRAHSVAITQLSQQPSQLSQSGVDRIRDALLRADGLPISVEALLLIGWHDCRGILFRTGETTLKATISNLRKRGLRIQHVTGWAPGCTWRGYYVPRGGA